MLLYASFNYFVSKKFQFSRNALMIDNLNFCSNNISFFFFFFPDDLLSLRLNCSEKFNRPYRQTRLQHDILFINLHRKSHFHYLVLGISFVQKQWCSTEKPQEIEKKIIWIFQILQYLQLTFCIMLMCFGFFFVGGRETCHCN